MTPVKKEQPVGNFLYNSAVTILAAAVISMGGFWMVEGRNFVGREEMNKVVHEQMEQVAKENPYLIDKSILTDGTKKLDKITDAIMELKLDVAKIQTKLELINKNNPSKQER